jgi:hypothetical protein
MAEKNQRAFHILNGIESEGFPHLRDYVMRDWSGGLNRHFFWQANARPPVFNYINHKFVEPDPVTRLPQKPKLPFGIHRLAFAAAVLTDSALCYSYPPVPERGETIGIWDELRMGTEMKLGWLGKPLSPAVRLATQQPDLLRKKGAAAGQEFLDFFKSNTVQFSATGEEVKVECIQHEGDRIRFRVTRVPTDGPDLFVTFSVRGAGMRGYPEEVARLMRVSLTSDRPGGFMTWIGRCSFQPAFWFTGLDQSEVELEFDVEGTEPVWISRLSVHAYPDVIYRQFENGLVLANPSSTPYPFDLSAIAPKRKFRRLQGSSNQDPGTNDGTAVSKEVVLPPKDALFLSLIQVEEGGQD